MSFPRILARAASRPTPCLTAALLLSVSFAAQADWNVAVGAASSNGAWSGANPDVWSPSATGATVAASEINSRLTAGTPVTINTSGGGAESGDISVNSAVTWAANTLTLTAARNIAINAAITANATAALAMTATAGAVNVGLTDAGFSGRVDFYQADGTTPRAGNGFLTINGNAYTVITALGAAGSVTATDLQGMSGGLAGRYALGANIDAAATSGWNSGQGFLPVGDGGSSFTGDFDGLGHTVSGLTINRDGQYVSLFARAAGVLRNVGVVGGSVTGAAYTGGLVGALLSGGTVSHSYASADVSATNSLGQVGGLVGWNVGGTVSGSHAAGNVSGTNYVGGLVGKNTSTVSDSHVSGGSVTASGVDLGGLVGTQAGTLDNSHYDIDSVTLNGATGEATPGGLYGGQYLAWLSNGKTLDVASYFSLDGDGYYLVGSVQALKDLLGFADQAAYKFRLTADLALPAGYMIPEFAAAEFDGGGHALSGLQLGLNKYYRGFIGWLDGGSVHDLGLTGVAVTGASSVGALVGYNNGGTVSNSYATGTVSGGSSYVGGLVGYNFTGSTVSNSYATGAVSGNTNVGGLVGYNVTGSTVSNSYATGAVSGSSSLGGLVGGSNGGTVTASFWDTQTSGRATSAGGTGKTTAQMQSLATYSAWDIDATGGTGKVWRIYDGYTNPLQRGFLTALTVTASAATKTYDGAAYSGGNGVTYSTAPNANLLGTLSYGGTSQGAANTGSYVLTPGGYWSNQQGYDIAYVSGALSIAAAPAPVYSPPAVIYASIGGTTTLSGTTPVTASPGSTLVIPAEAAVSGTVITLSATGGTSGAPVTIKIGANTLTVTPLGGDAVLTLKTVTIDGVATLVLALRSGTVSISAGPGQPLIMFINGGLITAGTAGGTVSQTMNGDGTATLSVTSGTVILPANAFAEVKDNLLHAGEIAQIGSDGKVTQVRLGSLGGSGAVGDPLTLKADPRRRMPKVLNLSGKLGRLGEQAPLAAIAAALGQTSLAQSADGTLEPGIAAIPVGASVDTSRADGVTRSGGVTEVAISGLVFRLVPTVNDFAAFLAAIDPAASATLDADGMLSLVAKGRQYVGRAGLALQAASGADGFSQDAAGNLVWTRAGQAQTLYPALRILEKLRAELTAFDPQATLSDNGDGNYAISLNGQTYTLRPDFRLLNLFDFPAQHTKDGWWLDGAKVFLNYGNATAQGMAVW